MNFSAQLVNLSAHLELEGTTYALRNLSIFGFETASSLPDCEGQQNAILVFGSNRMDVEFRVRRNQVDHSVCSFANLSISAGDAIQRHLESLQSLDGEDSLETRSYDELAAGLDSDSTNNNRATVSNEVRSRSLQFKSLAMVLMTFLMIGLTIMAILFMRSRSSLSVNNASLVGNYLPVNSKIDGEIDEVMVFEGQQVKKGDLLMRLKNPKIESGRIQAQAACDAAEAKVIALQEQLDSYLQKVSIADKKLALDMEVANSELQVAIKTRKANQARVELLAPFVQSGSVTQLEMDEANENMLAAESMVVAAENKVRQVAFAQQVASDGVLILGDRIDNEAGRITALLQIAKAELQELRIIYQEAEEQVKQLEIVAPRDGQIYTTYRQPGEYLKVADEAMAISFPGKTWVAGHLTPGQANRVRPGQPVKVSFPSLDMNLDGVVVAVGHRSIYSKGFYNADFRGSLSTDVPIKVRINDLPNEIPSGMRVAMSVNTGFGVEWLDKLVGFELKPVFEESPKYDPSLANGSDATESDANERESSSNTSQVTRKL